MCGAGKGTTEEGKGEKDILGLVHEYLFKTSSSTCLAYGN